ncbi:phage integrase central domain-containing protein [Marinobacter alkaliphilus]|uniref:Integrase arm-type DNA-binding domain-containing protein n=1 Tax=Marinobacter alkaliphilus TaxID=254719 RepID=A0ABZ3E801_9GAMM
MKRSQIKRRPLADTVLDNLEPESKDYREKDSPGLYFRVKSNGTKSWNLRYKRPNGKWAWLGLGSYPNVSGEAAREKAYALQKKAASGVDLKEYSEGKRSKPLFREVAEDWYRRKSGDDLAPKTLRLMRDALDNDILPILGDYKIDIVTRAQCTKVQSRIEERKAFEIAKKVRTWLNQIFKLAIAHGHREFNPAGELGEVARKAPPTKHHPFLLEPELPAFLNSLHRSNSTFNTRVGLWMLLLTASRPGMVRHAEWPEIDLDEALWTIPGTKMKKDLDIVISLPTQLVRWLELLSDVTGHCRWLFPGSRDPRRPISHTSFNMALNLMGYKGKLVGHGARHTASTLLRDHGWRKDFVERQLAHVEGGVSGVYNKAEYLRQRRQMMQWYADYLHALADGTAEEKQGDFSVRILR